MVSTHRGMLPAFVALWPAAAAFGQSPNFFVWFEATPASPAAGVLQQGAQGGDLVLSCDTSLGPATCAWDLTMQMTWLPVPPRTIVAAAGTIFRGDTDKHALVGTQSCVRHRAIASCVCQPAWNAVNRMVRC